MSVTRTSGAMVLAMALVGCGAPEPGSAGVHQGQLGAGAGATYVCGQAPGKTYAAHFTRTAGSCAASVDLDVTIGDLNDFCDAVGQVRTDGAFGAGLCDIGCIVGTQTCAFSAAVACANGCQGGYTIKFTAR